MIFAVFGYYINHFKQALSEIESDFHHGKQDISVRFMASILTLTSGLLYYFFLSVGFAMLPLLMVLMRKDKRHLGDLLAYIQVQNQ